MNKIIKEFLDDATEVVDDWHTGKVMSTIDYKIFAELIIRECIEICMKNQFQGADHYNNGAVSCAELIKNRFELKYEKD